LLELEVDVMTVDKMGCDTIDEEVITDLDWSVVLEEVDRVMVYVYNLGELEGM
jgi:hypothetical protein